MNTILKVLLRSCKFLKLSFKLYMFSVILDKKHLVYNSYKHRNTELAGLAGFLRTAHGI